MSKLKSNSKRANKVKANKVKANNLKEITIKAVGNMTINDQRRDATRQGADCFMDTNGNTHLLNDGKWTMQELVIDNDYLKQFKEIGALLGMDTSQYTLESLKAALA